MSGLHARANENRPMFGIGLMLLAWLAFSGVDVSAKWLGAAGFPALQIAFMRYAGHFAVSMSLIAKGGMTKDRFGTSHFGLVILRAFLLMTSTVLNFLAVRHLSLTLTSTILFSAPVIICALSWPLLGERAGPWRWAAILLGFCGILIAIRPFGESFHWAAFLSLASAMCFALYSILTRKLSGVVAVDTLQFYSGLTGTVALLPFGLYFWQMPETAFQWIIMIMIGFAGWLGHQLLTQAHSFAPASTLTPYGYSFIIYLTIWSYFVFGQLPNRWTVAGALIIVLAGLLIWFRERHKTRIAKGKAGLGM